MLDGFRFRLLILPNAPALDIHLLRGLIAAARSAPGGAGIDFDVATPGGVPVTSDDGHEFNPTGGAPPLAHALVVLGWSPLTRGIEERSIRVIRQAARGDAYVIGVGYGAILMAKAGVLDGRQATCHYDDLPVARERFPDIHFSEQLYVNDGRMVTCAGHLAITDMFLNFAKLVFSESLVASLANQLLSPPLRQARTPQHVGAFEQLKPQPDPRLEKAVAIMQNNIESPLGIDKVAQRVGVSVRQLQNLWSTRLGTTFQEYYLDIRLDRARSLLLHTDMQISEIALATGFSSNATLSRAFHQNANLSPRDYRSKNRDNISPVLGRNAIRTLSSIIDRHAGFLYRNLNDRIYTVLFVTRGIERLLGYSPAEFMSKPGRNMASIIHPDDLAIMQTNVDRAVELKQNWDIEFRYVHRDGRIVWVHEVGSGVFDGSGRLLYVEGIIVRNLNPPDKYLDTLSTD